MAWMSLLHHGLCFTHQLVVCTSTAVVLCIVSWRKATCWLQDGLEMEVDALLRRKYENAIRDISVVEREDLDLVRALRVLCCWAPERVYASCARVVCAVLRLLAATL